MLRAAVEFNYDVLFFDIILIYVLGCPKFFPVLICPSLYIYIYIYKKKKIYFWKLAQFTNKNEILNLKIQKKS